MGSSNQGAHFYLLRSSPNVALFQISRDAHNCCRIHLRLNLNKVSHLPFLKSIQLGSVIGSTGSPAFALDSLASAGAVCVELDCTRVR